MRQEDMMHTRGLVVKIENDGFAIKKQGIA
jgi:hypothetical protein